MEVRKLTLSSVNDTLTVYRSCVAQHFKAGFNQWDESYPSLENIKEDISKGWLYGGFSSNKLISVISITQDEPLEYKSLVWNSSSDYLIIHRLCVHEAFLRRGLAKEMMRFAETYAVQNNFSSIKLDTFSLNKGAVKFYRDLGYDIIGYVNFPKRTESNYTCFEKVF